MRVDLGGGDWADLKDPEEVTNADRKAALLHYYEQGAHGGWAGDTELYDGYLMVMLVAWSLECPLPSDDPEALGRLPIDKANRLYAAVKPMMDLTKPDFSPDGALDPKAVSASSPGSKRRSTR